MKRAEYARLAAAAIAGAFLSAVGMLVAGKTFAENEMLDRVLRHIVLAHEDPRPWADFLLAKKDRIQSLRTPFALPERALDPACHAWPSPLGDLAAIYAKWRDWSNALCFAEHALEKKYDTLTLRIVLAAAMETGEHELIQKMSKEHRDVVGDIYGVYEQLVSGAATGAIAKAEAICFPEDGSGFQREWWSSDSIFLMKIVSRYGTAADLERIGERVFAAYLGGDDAAQSVNNEDIDLTGRDLGLLRHLLSVCLYAYEGSLRLNRDGEQEKWRVRGQQTVLAILDQSQSDGRTKQLFLPVFFGRGSGATDEESDQD